MKVTYQTCCSVDVHKSFLVATIVKTTGGVEPSYQKKRFPPLIIQFLNLNAQTMTVLNRGIPLGSVFKIEINVVIVIPN